MNVKRLVKKAKNGSKDALLQLILEQKNDYYRLAYSFLGNEHDSMDAMEDMIVKLYENITALKKEESFYSWSKAILVNCCKNILRKKKKLVFIEEENIALTEINEIQQNENLINIHQMLSILNEYQREAIILKYLHDFDYQKVADLTNVSIGTAKSRVFQGIKKMKERFGGEEI